MFDDRARLARELARRIHADFQRETTQVFDVGDYYFQYITDEQPGVHLELVSNEYLDSALHISPASERILIDLGFNEPGEHLRNWWRQSEGQEDLDVLSAAVVDALVHAFHVHPDDIARSLGLRPAPYTGDPDAPFSVLRGTGGMVLLPEDVERDFQAYVLARRNPLTYESPWQSDVPAQFFAVVDEVERDALLELIAIAPAGPRESQVAWFRRERHGWVIDASIHDKVVGAWRGQLRILAPEQAQEVEPRLRFRDGTALMEPQRGLGVGAGAFRNILRWSRTRRGTARTQEHTQP